MVTIVESEEQFNTAIAGVSVLLLLPLLLSVFKDILVVVDFFATWCGPCKMIAPKLESMSKEMAGKVVFLKVKDLTQHMFLRSILCIPLSEDKSYNKKS